MREYFSRCKSWINYLKFIDIYKINDFKVRYFYVRLIIGFFNVRELIY